MLSMIIPMVIATIGYFLAHLGSTAQIRFFTVIGVILIIISVIYFCYNAGYNIGYLLY